MGALSASQAAKAKAKENQRNADISAAQTQFSPWTGVQPQGFSYQDPNAAGGMLGGAASGALSGLMHKQANAGPPAPAAAGGGGAMAPGQSPYSSFGSAGEASGAAALGPQQGPGMSPWSGMEKKKNPFLYGNGGGGFSTT